MTCEIGEEGVKLALHTSPTSQTDTIQCLKHFILSHNQMLGQVQCNGYRKSKIWIQEKQDLGHNIKDDITDRYM